MEFYYNSNSSICRVVTAVACEIVTVSVIILLVVCISHDNKSLVAVVRCATNEGSPKPGQPCELVPLLTNTALKAKITLRWWLKGS